ncbi:MAG TPA: thiamine-phosphate kinase [Kineosporiaceae bacterium]
MTSTGRDARRFSDVGEDGVIASVVARCPTQPAHVVLGPGDDAAVLDVRGPVVISTDTLVEGHDFRRDWSSASEVGVKTAAQNLADVAAMGARPLALVVSLAASADLPVEWAEGLAEGLDDECRRAGAAVVGGDIAAAAQVVVTGTALGVLPTGVTSVTRAGARPGDQVALAGRTGPSAAGLALLLAASSGTSDPASGTPDPAGRGERPAVPGLASGVRDTLLSAHRAPRPPYPAGPEAAAAGATAMIDTSDGLLRDAIRVAEASGVVIDLRTEWLIPGADLVAAAEHLGDPALARQWVLTGGEDHALLACFPPGVELPASFRRVGRVLPRAAEDDDSGCGEGAPGRPGVCVDGRPWTGPTGWHHFS